MTSGQIEQIEAAVEMIRRAIYPGRHLIDTNPKAADDDIKQAVAYAAGKVREIEYGYHRVEHYSKVKGSAA
ncbi:MAG: hypothetical protein PHE11_05580 [Candidatus Omnitrophica bacterium]|nr:hypothetical protein [Candidatus Omnitrophota bacterium]